MRSTIRSAASSLPRDNRGVALIEFAFVLPLFVMICIAGSELTNYTTTKMRLSQIALQTADNAARLGNGSPLAAKTISEADINDVFAGAQIESGKLDIAANGRIILSSLENNAATNGPSNAYKIGWQRCFGTKTAHGSTYGTAGSTRAYMGPADKQTKVLADNATMFVEVYYQYRPIINIDWSWIPSVIPNERGAMVEVASMAVRDRRNLAAAPDSVAGVSRANC